MQCDYYKYISLSFIYQINNNKKMGNIHLGIQKGYLCDITEDETDLNYEERLYKQISKIENSNKLLFNKGKWIHLTYKALYEDLIIDYIKTNNDFTYERIDEIPYESQHILANITDEHINQFISLHNILYSNKIDKIQLIEDIYNKIIENKIALNIKHDIILCNVGVITNCYAKD